MRRSAHRRIAPAFWARKPRRLAASLPEDAQRERIDAAGIAMLVATTLALAVWAVFATVVKKPIDFPVYYLAARIWSEHGSPYTMTRTAWFVQGYRFDLQDIVWPYRYPPYTAAFLRPFVSLGEPVLLAIWQAASVAATVVATALVARTLGGGRAYAAAFLVLLGFAPAYDTLLTGQINGFLLLSLAVALWAMVGRRDRVLGFGLAAGTAMKLVPAALVAYLVVRRRWRAVAWFFLGLALLTAICVPLVGAQAFVDYAHWAIDLTRPESVMNGPTNVTFVGAMGRLLPHHLALARTLGRCLALAGVLVTIALCWPRRGRPRDDALAFAMIVALLPLLPPFTWYHQVVLLLVPLLVVGQRLWRGGRHRLLAVLAALFAATDVMWVAIHMGYWFGLEWPEVYYRLSFATLLCVAVWGACARELWLVTWSSEAARPRAEEPRAGEAAAASPAEAR